MRNILDLSPNFSKKTREKSNIKFVIIHYTGMQSEMESFYRLKDKKSKVSCHYIINKKGKIFQMVLDKHSAWHAGKSRWQNYRNLNKYSIGIELVNRGHAYGYENYSKKQINSLIKLCKKLKTKYRLKKENFLGHSDVAPLRKIDPGEKFPWEKMSKISLGLWYNKKKLKNQFKVKKNLKYKELFFKNLHNIGYRYFQISKRKSGDKKVIRAFQMRFIPREVTGKIDKKTLQISSFLSNLRK